MKYSEDKKPRASSRNGPLRLEAAGDRKKSPMLHLPFCGSLKDLFQSGTYHQLYIPILIQMPVYNLDAWPGTMLLFTMI